MASDDVDLDAYFRRIDHDGPRNSAFDTLCAIHAAHVASIPFENLDVLLRRPIRLNVASLQKKLIHDRRGGYCFEQNGLLAHVLRALGFRVTPLAARVRWGVADGVDTSRSHMLLKVDFGDQAYFVDVGFGGQTPGAPLAFAPGLEQATRHGLYRLIEFGAGLELQLRVGGAWAPLYRFTLEPQIQPDYEVANWYVSTHPESIFVRNLLAARQLPDRRYTLLNNQFAIRRADGVSEDWMLGGVDELVQILSDYFGIESDSIGDQAETRLALGRCLTPGRA